MNLLGYLITLANVQHFDNSKGPIKDLSIKVADVQTLCNELLGIPGLDLERFRETGYYRYMNVGKYLSKNLRDYMYYGEGNPTDEGVVLTLLFNDTPGPGLVNGDDTLSLFLHKGIEDEDNVKEQVQGYIDGHYSRNKRTMSVF